MYDILFYKNKNQKNEIENFLLNLKNKKDKSSRIKFNKITAYINLLSKYGINLGEPYIKYINNDIWELRPLRYRILFTYLNNNFILLTIFLKKSQKTPNQEIDKAKRYLDDFIKRSDMQ